MTTKKNNKQKFESASVLLLRNLPNLLMYSLIIIPLVDCCSPRRIESRIVCTVTELQALITHESLRCMRIAWLQKIRVSWNYK